MPRNPERLKTFLQLSPLASKSITFMEFLLSLQEHPGRADAAPAILYRAIMAMGEEDIQKEPSAKRRQYLKMLKDLNIPALNAFRHVAGSQRFALQPMSFLRSASEGGAQRLQMVIFDGGPGSGKDFFKDGIVHALEYYTEEVEKIYAVKGCPHNENPINLLKLLKPDMLRAMAEELEFPDLPKIVDLGCEPCPDCYRNLMGTVQEPKETPCFDCIEVVPMRVSTRSTGIADWQPGGKASLIAALRKANRGFLSMPDAFIERKPREGETDERLVLLDVTQYHRLPGETDAAGNVTANSPHDAIILATTNRKALDGFLASVPDKDAFTSRSAILRLPYNTIRCEEVRAYESELKKYKKRAHFDPLVLEVMATLAVLSRLAKPRKKGRFPHPLDVIKLYQGDSIQPKLRPDTEFSSVWDTPGASSPSWAPAKPATDSGEEVKELVIPDGMPLSTELLWSVADPEEGMNGLDMRLMMGLLSSINQLGLQKPGKEKCVSSLEVLGILRAVIYKKAKTGTNTDKQQEVYNRCLKWLGGVPLPGAEPPSTPDIIEAEYRLMLREMLLRVFAPDYETRAQKLFADYRLHVSASFKGEQQVRDPELGLIPVSTAKIDELDHYRVGKEKRNDAGAFIQQLTEEDKRFRGSLDALISVLRDEYFERPGVDKTKPFKVDWDTIPELAKAIRGKLDEEVGALIDKLITTEVKSDLKSTELEQLERAEQALEELGFCHGLQKPILEYAKRTKVWSFKLN